MLRNYRYLDDCLASAVGCRAASLFFLPPTFLIPFPFPVILSLIYSIHTSLSLALHVHSFLSLALPFPFILSLAYSILAYPIHSLSLALHVHSFPVTRFTLPFHFCRSLTPPSLYPSTPCHSLFMFIPFLSLALPFPFVLSLANPIHSFLSLALGSGSCEIPRADSCR